LPNVNNDWSLKPHHLQNCYVLTLYFHKEFCKIKIVLIIGLACELSSRYISPVERDEGNSWDAHPTTEGQGQAVELRVLESWNRKENTGQGQEVELCVLESWKG
jgi:hypothetical protein